MSADRSLAQVAAWHATAVGFAALVLESAGRPSAGVLVGGATIAIFAILLAGAVRASFSGGGMGWVTALIAFKLAGYAIVAYGGTSLPFAVDGPGFVLGITCFVAAALGFAAAQHLGKNTWNTDSPG